MSAEIIALRPAVRPAPALKLFHVRTTGAEICGCSDVTISWFRWDHRPEPVAPYEQVIRYYDPKDDQRGYAEGAVDELFSADEATAVAAYLIANYPSEVVISAANLPIDMNRIGLGATPFGGGVDAYMLWEDEHYSLPFKVGGYFDVREGQRAVSTVEPLDDLFGSERRAIRLDASSPPEEVVHYIHIDKVRRSMVRHIRRGLRPPVLHDIVRAECPNVTLDEYNTAADACWAELSDVERASFKDEEATR